jgi:hypothetical protein
MAAESLTLAWLLLAVGGAPGDVWPINQRNFQIPIRIDEARRPELKELLLFCSSDQGRTWNQVAVATPDKGAFPFYAPADGIYWFSVCVIDRQGKREPADIYRSPPAQKILIDTVKPTLRITSVERQGEELVVGWEIQDEAPDLNTLKLEFQPADAPPWLWHTAPITPAATGQARLRLDHPGPTSIRLQVADQAGNVATATAQGAAPGVQGMSAGAGQSPPPAPPPGASPSGNYGSLPNPPPLAPPPEVPGGFPRERTVPVHPTSLPRTDPRGPSDSVGTASGASAADAGGAQPAGARWAATSETLSAGARSVEPLGTRPPTAATAPAQLSNSTQVALEYAAKAGPSGIAKVELWLITEDGRGWRPHAEDPDWKSPINFTLPGDGVYGFTLVVHSGAMKSKGPPQANDPPQLRLEVDTTPPEVKLGWPEADAVRRDALVITWSVADRNLESSPITLEWAQLPDGAWNTIATELPNTGRYTWVIPPSTPYKVFLRLTARDKAGNSGVAQTREPVLIDLYEPEAQIIGVAGTVRRP